jgi:hypothetical protein
MRKFVHIFFIISITGILTGCVSTEKKPFIGKWQMTFDQDVLSADFNKDGTCTLSDNENSWQGTWHVEDDEIILKTDSDSLIGNINEQGELMLYEYIDGIKGTAPVTLKRINNQ